MSRLIYLAVPYSDPDPAVREERFHVVNEAAAVLMGQGLYVFSPISHTHPIAAAGALPLGWDFWEGYDREMLSACGALVVLCLDGWNRSTGVTSEIAIAEELGLPVFFVVSISDCASGIVKEWMLRCEADAVAAEALNIKQRARVLRAIAEGENNPPGQ